MTRVEYLRASSLKSSFKGEASGQSAEDMGGLHSKQKTVLGLRKSVCKVPAVSTKPWTRYFSSGNSVCVLDAGYVPSSA